MPESERQFVQVGEKYYPIEAFDAAFHGAVIDRLKIATPRNASPRALYRVARGLRTEGAHRLVLAEALKRLSASSEHVELEDETNVVGRFPASLTI